MSTKENVSTPAYLSLNWANGNELKKIGSFAELQELFRYGFVTIDGPRDSQEFAHYLKVQGVAPNYHWIGIDLLDPSADSLDEIISSAVNDAPPGVKPALIVSGLEYSVGIAGNCSPLLDRIYSMREGTKKIFPCPIVFLMPKYGMERIKKCALEFYTSGLLDISLLREWPDSPFDTIELPAPPLGDAGLKASAEELGALDQMLLKRPGSLSEKMQSVSFLGMLDQMLRQDTGPSFAQGDLFLLRGQIYSSRSEYEKAYRDYVASFESYSSLSATLKGLGSHFQLLMQSKGGEALALCSLANLFCTNGDPSRGVDHAELALCRHKENRDARGIISTLSLLGSLHLELGDHEKSERLHRLALREAEEEFGEGHPLLVEPLSNLAEFLQGQGMIQEAEEMQSLAVRILADEGEVDPVEVGQSLALLSLIQRDRGRWESAEATPPSLSP